jgi:hypothetical protein
MQYAPDPIDDFAPRRVGPRIKRQMLDEMDAPMDRPAPLGVGVESPLVSADGMPRSGNTGIGGGVKPIAPAPESAPKPAVNAQHLLMSAVNDNLGTIRSAQGDAARKAAVEQVLRGVNADGIEEIRGEKVKMGGKWIDLLQDVEGAAIPQWLVEEQGGAAPQQGGITRGMDPMQTSLMDSIRASIMQLMGQGQV